jgi:uncharacterized Tic20 family protein
MAEQGAPEQAGQSGASPQASEANKWGMLCHLAALAGLIGIPFGNVIGPLVVWLLKKNEYPFVDAQGKAALNFQLSMLIYGLVCAMLILVAIGFLLLAALYIFDLIMIIMASVQASNGQSFRYPLAIRFLK